MVINGRQVKAGHQQAVEQAAQQTYAQADDHQQRSVHPAAAQKPITVELSAIVEATDRSISGR